MKSIVAFLKACIVEVITEPVPRPSKKLKGISSLVKHCIAEVIVEPGMTPERLRNKVKTQLEKRIRVVGNPKFDMSKLIKECTFEVLKENVLAEAFDPQSQGPNMPQENPYPEWNAKMAKMEENDEPGQPRINCPHCGKQEVVKYDNGEYMCKSCGWKSSNKGVMGENLELTATGKEDGWSRPIYVDKNGKVYVDINLGNGEPSIHTITSHGEPLSPIKNFTIVGSTPTEKFPNALCPRCKNSKPELMTNHPNGSKTCNSCHWSNSGNKSPSLNEGEKIYKDRQGGQWVYWIQNPDGGKIFVSPQNVQKYLRQGSRLIALEPWNDPNSMKNFDDKGIQYEETKTFQEIRDKEDPKGINHNLTLECVHCGNQQTCRCSKPKKVFKGVCESCSKKRLNEWSPEQDQITKIKQEVFKGLEAAGFRHLGDEPRDSMEYYLNGFVTVSIFISYDDHKAYVERYYDSEMVDNMPGHHINAKIPIDFNNPNIAKQLIALCIKLKKAAAGDEAIFGGMDDLQERAPALEWTCPHCKKKAGIILEVESAYDYIAFADCQHCGREISDSKLDKAIYEVVSSHYQSLLK